MGKVTGQNHIKTHFENAIKMDKISHAYIINGEEGSGKMSLALEFAKALQCDDNNIEEDENLQFDFGIDSSKDKKPTGVACGQCKSCHQIESGNHPDVKIVSYEKAGIGVDEIREQLNEDILIKPYTNRYKVYIIPDSQSMTVQAQNALLKTIEEPPEYGIIIMLTTNADSFLQTILSRCVLLNIRPTSESLIKSRLMSEYGVGEYQARVAIAFANGNVGKAIKFATSEDFTLMKNHVVATMESLETCGMDRIAQVAKEVAAYKKQINEFFCLMRMWFRDVLMYKSTVDIDGLIFQDDYKAVANMAKTVEFSKIDEILKAMDRAEERIRSNVNTEMTIESLLLAIKERIR